MLRYCNLFIHLIPLSLETRLQGYIQPGQVTICWFLWRGQNWKNRKKEPKDSQQQTEPRWEARCGNPAQSTVVRGEFSHRKQCFQFKIT